VIKQLSLAAFFALVVLLFPTEAAACCSGLVCPHCISSSSDCVTSESCIIAQLATCPTCNFLVCDCNTQCGCQELTGTSCSSTPCCGSDPAADRAAARARFDSADTNRNNKISRAEGRKWLEKTFGPKWVEKVPDRGKASAAQIYKRLFDQVDKDRNGVITPGEMDKSLS